MRAIAREALELFDSGFVQIKEILASLTMEERWAVMLTADNMDEAAFAKFAAQCPEWKSWCSSLI